MLKIKTDKYLFFVVFTWILVSCSHQKAQNNISEFYSTFPSYSAVSEFSGYKIQTRGNSYLVGFPNSENWHVYKFDSSSQAISFIQNSETENKSTSKEVFEDSLKNIAKDKLTLFTRYNLIKIDGTLDKNNVIEISFSAEDALSYINGQDSSSGRREDFIKNNATKLNAEVYQLKRKEPLDLADY